MVWVLTGLGVTASHCRAEDGIRAAESIPKANHQTNTHHISCCLILPPRYSSEGEGISGQSASLLRADVVCVWNSATSLLSSYWLDPLSSLGILETIKRITSLCQGDNNSFSICTHCVGERQNVWDSAPAWITVSEGVKYFWLMIAANDEELSICHEHVMVLILIPSHSLT